MALNVLANLRYPGSEPSFWYLLPSLDVTVVLLVVALFGSRRWLLPGIVVGTLTGLFVFLRLLRIADGIEGRYFSTTFNLYMDLPLLPELVRLYYATSGPWKFALTTVCVIAGLIALVWVTYKGLRLLQSALLEVTGRRMLLALLGLFALASPWVKSDERRIGVFGRSAAPRLLHEATLLINGRRYRANVEHDVARVDSMITGHPNNLAKLAGANVYIFLIESYGQTVLEHSNYRTRAQSIYARIESELKPMGFAMASGILDSPTYGGGSWLAHATLGTGVVTNDQFRYRVVVEANPLTLAASFRKAGYGTVLAQPATTRPWPEGEFYRFDRKYYAWNFDYKGPAYSWAVMPDQYVVDFIRRAELQGSRRRLFAQIALVSSHAPWNSQPPIIYDESQILEGSIYNQRRTITFPTDWTDMSQAGDAYMHSIGYDFEVLRRFLERHVQDDTLVVILGDHQPNGEVTAHSAAHGVPIHVLSRKKDFIEVFLARGYVDGMEPDLGRRHFEMASFFPTFIADFSTAAAS